MWFIPNKLVIPFWMISIFFKIASCSIIIYTIYKNTLVNTVVKNLFVYVGLNSVHLDQMNNAVIAFIMLAYSLICIPNIMLNKRALKEHPLIQLMNNSNKSYLMVKLGYVLPNIVGTIVILFSYSIVSIFVNKYSHLPVIIQSICLLVFILLIFIDSNENFKWVKNRNILLFLGSVAVGGYISRPFFTYLHDIYSPLYGKNFIYHGINSYIVIPILLVIILLIAMIPKENYLSVYNIQKNTNKVINIFFVNGMLYFLLMGILIGLLIYSKYSFTNFFLLIIITSYPNTILVETALKTNPHYYEYMGQSQYFPLLERNFKQFQISFNIRILKLLLAPYLIISILWLIHSYDFSGIFTIIKYFIITGLWAIIIQESGMLAKISQKSDIYIIYNQSRLSNLRNLIEGLFYIVVPVAAIPEIMYMTVIISKSLLIKINIIQILIMLIITYVLFKYREKNSRISEIRRHTLI